MCEISADLCVVPEEDPEYKHVTFQTCLEFWLFPSQSKFSGKLFIWPIDEQISKHGFVYLAAYKPAGISGLSLVGRRYTKPRLQAKKKNQYTINTKKKYMYSDDALSDYTGSSLKAVSHRYILFVFLMSFFRLQSGLSISWALHTFVLL